MDAGGSGGGGGAAPSTASHGRASTALAAVSVFLVLLCLFWRLAWQCLKHERRSGTSAAAAATSSSSSSAPAPSCPSPDGAAAYVSAEAARRTPRATTTASASPLPVFVRVAAAAGFGAEKVDCAVCLAELGGDGEPAARLVPGCGHGFHAECIEAWFRVNSTCPLCRAAVQSAGEAPPRHCSSV